MKLLTKDTDYAVRALIALAKSAGEYTSARKIAEQDKIPYEYLRKVLQVLMKEGFVESREGGRGGFKIKRNTNDMGLIEIINIFQGEVQLTECIFRKQLCHNRKTCVLRKNIKRIEKKVIDEFKGITIGTLMKEAGI